MRIAHAEHTSTYFRFNYHRKNQRSENDTLTSTRELIKAISCV